MTRDKRILNVLKLLGPIEFFQEPFGEASKFTLRFKDEYILMATTIDDSTSLVVTLFKDRDRVFSICLGLGQVLICCEQALKLNYPYKVKLPQE